MGCWSVNCGISKIAITHGQHCVLLPLKKSNSIDYQSYQPATLPIFGIYDDYGGIENIVKDDNTELIEQHFGVTIEEFVEFLVDGKFYYDRKEAEVIGEKIKNVDDVKEWQFMFIDRNVYDLMKINHNEYEKGRNSYGTPGFMKLFGFELDENEKVPDTIFDKNRWNKIYKKGDLTLYSDGQYLINKESHFIHRIINNQGKYGIENSLNTYMEIPKELKHLEHLAPHEMWRVMDKFDFIKNYIYLMSERYNNTLYKIFFLEEINSNHAEFLYEKYFYELDTFGDQICELINFRMNLHCMSGEFKPFVMYLTPQCGERKQHQIFLEKFAEINKEYMKDYYDEDDEDEDEEEFKGTF